MTDSEITLTRPSNKRDNRIDVLRGMAILLVVLEHALGSSLVEVQDVILAFHMPLFFMISGYLAKDSSEQKFGTVLLKKVRTILLPNVVLGVISYAYDYVITYKLLGGGTGYPSLWDAFFGYWFLLVLFQVAVLWEIFIRLKINIRVFKFILLVVATVYTFIIPTGTRGFLYVAVTPVAFGFYVLGNIIKDYNLSRKVNIWLTVPTAVALVIVALYNDRVLMYCNQYGYVVLFILTSLLGAFILNQLSYRLTDIKPLQWLGMNSIIIYVLHFSIVQGTRGVLVRLLPINTENPIMGLMAFAIGFTVTILASMFCSRYLGFLFGKPFKRRQ